MLTFPNFDSIETIKDIFYIVNTNYLDLPMFGGVILTYLCLEEHLL